MPVALLHAYTVMLPRLEAEQILSNAWSAGLGFGGSKEDVADLQRQAKGEKPIAKSTMTGQQFAASLGIPIRVKKKKKKVKGRS